MSKRALSCRGRRAAIVSAMLLAACAGSAAAGEIALQGLASTPNPQRFIVTYRDGVGPVLSARALPLAHAAGIVPARRWTGSRPRR
ncbi:hypothetical protein KM547_04025 [Xanthomonas translucens pv. phlei]|uniref:Putative membrane protein n=1 Tax=Xanthomonas graminis pv. phlei TaxID=487906 RepID=A0A0K2ZLK1_9XANT|nr:hypothetical protein KM547_04025 [Xanthomonas translucens pv. phlei]CTP85847.1 putative membrane protein [Xanthomonas translucens pv. phlei]